ncbi:hypothetical protein M0802_012670 [Mischocyttarus mexicanus]|nr:hypothetical protein M0802_012670 [Mischocyttarus mexicanus]
MTEDRKSQLNPLNKEFFVKYPQESLENETKKSRAECKIVIIGAGVAGIAAACKLLTSGFKNVIILEASKRVGGQNVVDLGAEWVYGEDGNTVYNMAYQHELLSSSKGLNNFDQYLFGTCNGTLYQREHSTGILKAYHDYSECFEEMTDSTEFYGDYIFRKLSNWCDENDVIKREREHLLQWVHQLDSSKRCCRSWYNITCKGAKSYWKCQGDNYFNWKENGFIKILDCLANRIPDSKNSLDIMEIIKFDKEVILVDYMDPDNICVTVKLDEEKLFKYEADHVIFTPSLGVLKAKYRKMFKPRLPNSNINAIKSLGFGTVHKIFLQFPTRWWADDVSVFCCPWMVDEKKPFLRKTSSEYAWLFNVFAFYTIDSQPNVLCAWVGRESALKIEQLQDHELEEGLHLLLVTFFGKHYTIPKPINLKRTIWNRNHLFKGSYSFPTILSDRIRITPHNLANPVMSSNNKPLILFAGEATHNKFFATVHGAIESGIREAERLICHYWNPQLELTKLSIKEAMEQKPMFTPDVVIIGAGIAGLAAAKTLEDANFKNYLLIEAQSSIGGRISSQLMDGKWIELGAQYLHGDQSKLAKFCDENKLSYDIQSEDGGGTFITYKGKQIDDDLIQEVKKYVYDVLDESENETVQGEYKNIGRMIRNRFNYYLTKSEDKPEIKELKEGIFEWLVRFLIIDNSCLTLDDLSVKKYGTFKVVGGPQHLTIKSGYKYLLKTISNNIPSKNILLNTPVQIINWKSMTKKQSERPITLILDNKKAITAKCVIITCSLGYLKDNLETMFVPCLPESHFLSIMNMGFGVVNKIYLNFGKPWWKPETKGFQFVWEKNKQDVFGKDTIPIWAKDLTGFDVVKNHCGVLLGWIGGQSASIIEKVSEEEVAVGCRNLLKHFLKDYDIPPVKECIRTTWSSNKYIRGGYSNLTPACEESNITPATLGKPIFGKSEETYCKNLPIMLFAGEATHETFYSTTHGAYETGIKQAKLYLRYHQMKY